MLSRQGVKAYLRQYPLPAEPVGQTHRPDEPRPRVTHDVLKVRDVMQPSPEREADTLGRRVAAGQRDSERVLDHPLKDRGRGGIRGYERMRQSRVPLALAQQRDFRLNEQAGECE